MAIVQLYWAGESPKAIVADEGFRELAYLCRVMKERTGMTPRLIHEKGQKDLTQEDRARFKRFYFKLWENINKDLETEESILKPAQRRRKMDKLDREFEAISEDIRQFLQIRKDHQEVIFNPKDKVN